MEPRTDFLQPERNSNLPLLQQFVYNKMASDFKILQLSLFHVAVSPFSGPIALLRDKSIPTADSLAPELQNCVMFFSQKGKTTRSVPLTIQSNNRCVMFGFTSEEILVVVQQSGTYHLIDPFRGSSKTFKLGESLNGQRILAGRILQGNRLYALSSSKKVFQIADLFQPVPKQRIMLAPRVENPVMFLEIQNGELDATYLHQNGDIYNWSKNQYLFTNELAEYRRSTLAYMNKKIVTDEDSDNSIVYWVFVYHRPFRIVFIRSPYNNSRTGNNLVKVFQPDLPTADQVTPISTSSSSKRTWKESLYHTAWIGNRHCMLSNGLWTVIFNTQECKILSKEPGHICPEVDGVRIYGQSNLIIREVSQAYRDMFKDSPNPIILELFTQFSKYQEGDVVEREILQKYRNDAANIYNSVLDAAEFSIQPLEQMRILKFAVFLKTYFCITANQSSITLNELCADLRFINNLKYEFGNRILTLQQLRHLKEKEMERLTNILLRYNLHYLGDIIGGGEKIYIHWAKCKIEKETSEAAAVQQIVDKFESYRKREKKSISFVELARYSVQTGRFQLAQKLIEYEPNVEKKVTILLWMAIVKKDPLFAEKALDNAHLSHNSDIIFKVLKEVEKSSTLQQTLYKVLERRPLLKQHYIKYLRQMYPEKLKEYFFKTKSNIDIGYIALDSYLTKANDESLKVISNYLPPVAEAISLKKANPYTKFLRELRSSNRPVDETEIQKFKDVEHPQFMAEILFSKGMTELGVKVLYRIKNDEAYRYLEQYDRWREAAILAKDRKNPMKLRQLLEKVPAAEKPLVQELLGQLQNKGGTA